MKCWISSTAGRRLMSSVGNTVVTKGNFRIIRPVLNQARHKKGAGEEDGQHVIKFDPRRPRPEKGGTAPRSGRDHRDEHVTGKPGGGGSSRPSSDSGGRMAAGGKDPSAARRPRRQSAPSPSPSFAPPRSARPARPGPGRAKASASQRKRTVVLPAKPTPMSVSQATGVRAVDVIKLMIRMGDEPQTAHDPLSLELAELLVAELGFVPVHRRTTTRVAAERRAASALAQAEADDAADDVEVRALLGLDQTVGGEPVPPPPPRIPVACVIGHIDHGKTTLLDALRAMDDAGVDQVAATEAGGITQRLGAFHTWLGQPAGDRPPFTFIDTPGHFAFHRMREAGCAVTDVAVLAVAADSGVQEQTVEALSAALAAHQDQEGVAPPPLIVALTKCDVEDADPDAVEAALIPHGVVTERNGGDVPSVRVSAKTGAGLDELCETLMLQADLLDLRAPQDPGHTEAVVVESRVVRGLGPLATAVVRRGRLEPGQALVCGPASGRARVLVDPDGGQTLDCALPGAAVGIVGLSELPHAGAMVRVAPSDKVAASVAQIYRRQAQRRAAVRDQAQYAQEAADQLEQERRELAATGGLSRPSKPDLKGLGVWKGSRESASGTGDQEQEGAVAGNDGAALDGGDDDVESSVPVLRLVCKADSAGSLDALTEALLAAVPAAACSIELVGTGVGAVGDSDVELAASADAHVVCFGADNVSAAVKQLAGTRAVHVFSSEIIYRVLDRVVELAEQLLPSVDTETEVGQADVAQVFEVNRGGARSRELNVAGCKVTQGLLKRGSLVRVLRPAVTDDTGSTTSPVTVADKVKISSIRHFKETVNEARKGTECGVSLDQFGDFVAGDRLICYEVHSEKQTFAQAMAAAKKNEKSA